MSEYINKITNSLNDLISEVSENPSLFVKNPKTDFTRNRKIDFKKFVGITMNSGGGTMSKELLDYFDFDANTPSVSAYTQQRSKVLPPVLSIMVVQSLQLLEVVHLFLLSNAEYMLKVLSYMDVMAL